MVSDDFSDIETQVKRTCPRIEIYDGETGMAFDDDAVAPLRMNPIRRASYIARLRALANELEKGDDE